MNTTFFKYAIEVEHTRSITQAAQNLFMAQPNLSKAIKEMEELLGFRIFKRTSKGVIPTPKGNEFLAYARNIMAQLNKIELLSKPQEDNIQAFNISVPRGSYISHAFIRFMNQLDRNKGIEINLQETNAMTTILNIAAGKFDLGIIRCQKRYERYFLDFLREKQIRYELIWEFEQSVIFSTQSELAQQEQLHHSQLKNFTEIVHGDEVIPYLADKVETRSGAEKNGMKKIYLCERWNQFELLSQIPDTYMWASPIPPEYLSRYGLLQRKCSIPDNQYQDILIYENGYATRELDQLFLSELYQVKKELLKNFI